MSIRDQINAVMEAVFSYQVQAINKREAIEVAQFRLNESKLLIQQLKLVNEQGEQRMFHVDRVESLELDQVELTEYNGRFNVLGRIRVLLSTPSNQEQGKSAPIESSYRLPSSSVRDVAVLTVPSRSGPVFLCIRKHTVDWKENAREDVYFKVG